MRLAFVSSPNPGRLPLSRRAMALGLTLAAHLFLLWLLLRLAPPQVTLPAEGNPLMTFDVAPVQKAAPKPRAMAKSKSAERPRPRPAAVAPPPRVASTMPELIPGLEKFDLRNVRSSVAEAASPGTGQDSAAAYGPGEGPGGARLYNAEWYREPTPAQIAFYLPAARARTGWGMIACQTVERYRVENCRELGNEPPGSGLSRVVREAAWQFLVRPPRIDGKPVIGAWVRIRIDFTKAGPIIDKSRGS